jgi:hypothetical protein
MHIQDFYSRLATSTAEWPLEMEAGASTMVCRPDWLSQFDAVGTL